MAVDDVYSRIKDLCQERGWSYYRLIQESGIPSSTFYNMMERRSIPQIDLIQKICDAFSISISQFFDPERDMDGLTVADMELLTEVRRLSAKNRERLLAYLQTLLDNEG